MNLKDSHEMRITELANYYKGKISKNIKIIAERQTLGKNKTNKAVKL
jgi:hypothetical protein